jgi:hypothetical protein
MMRKGTLACLLCLLVLAACAGPRYEVMRPPLRDAGLYPLAQTREGVSVAIDEIANPQRAWRYFGVNLPAIGLLPVNVIVSNHGVHKILLHPADVLLYRGREVFDPLPIEVVSTRIKRAVRPADAETAGRIERYLSEISLTENLLGINERYQGVLFFEVVEPRQKRWPSFTVWTLFPEQQLKLNVHLTVIETNDRLIFGPFSLTGPPRP